ncbi:L,D-transpeptidase [Rhodobacter sp. NSM]|uniref:L,D-transpeptidase n=1 Tax=Rhodobacter sp. NSM TaxID=3457501 RepID=UPI003FCF8D59
MQKLNLRRRGILSAAAAAFAGLALAGGVREAEAARQEPDDWRNHFSTLEHGAILADLRQRVVIFWSEDGAVQRRYPTAVPAAREFSRLGGTRVIRKVEGPTWRPTPLMRERDPALPASLPPGPGNPFGSHALYLEWDHYRIHGTDDPSRVGSTLAHGCIGLANAHIAELFGLATIGTQVRLV